MKGFVPSPAVILFLVPIFLILSSSVYPAIISNMDNEEIKIISKVMAKLNEKNIDTSSHHSTMPLSSSQDITPTSPTPIDPSFSATSSTFATEEKSGSAPTNTALSEEQQRQDEVDNKMVANVINAGDLAHVVWQDSTSGNNEILYKRDGADFDPTTENLSNNAASSGSPGIAAAGNNVHIVWQEDGEIWYKRSITSGATYSLTFNLSTTSGNSLFPAIAVSGNNVHVVWSDTTPGNSGILYKRSTDGGATFGPTINLSNNAGQSTRPAIAVSGSNVHVAWSDNTLGNFDILYRRSTDNGAAFQPIKNLSNNVDPSEFPSIATSGNNIHVVWQDGTPGNSDIFYRRSLDHGNTFPNIIKNLSGNTGLSSDPAIAVSGNIIHVVWTEGGVNADILYRRSLDGGSTFPNVIKNLSSNFLGVNSGDSNITTSGDNVYVVWLYTINSDILYRTSSDDGNTFSAELTNLSANDGPSGSPKIAVS